MMTRKAFAYALTVENQPTRKPTNKGNQYCTLYEAPAQA